MYQIKPLKNRKEPKFIIDAEFMFGDADEYKKVTAEYSVDEFTEEVQKAWHAIEEIYGAPSDFWEYDNDELDYITIRINEDSISRAIKRQLITEDDALMLHKVFEKEDYTNINLLYPYSEAWGDCSECCYIEVSYIDENNATHDVEWVD